MKTEKQIRIAVKDYENKLIKIGDEIKRRKEKHKNRTVPANVNNLIQDYNKGCHEVEMLYWVLDD